MRNLKFVAILAFLMPAFFAINSCNVIKCDNAYPYFSLRYNGKYTGIDTLINVDGYYNFQESISSGNTVTFYRDGCLTSHFFTKRANFSAMRDKSFLRMLESGLVADSILVNTCNGFGLYTIINDTIKSQIYYNYGMSAGGYIERWYKIISKDKLLVIKYQDLKDKSSIHLYNNQELHFYPAWRPDSTDNWLRDCLREKGARR